MQSESRWRAPPAVAAIIACALAVCLMVPAAWAEPLERGPLTLHGGEARHTLQVEVARTPQQRTRGLMERDSLAPDAGMLFVYDNQQGSGNAFWMYRTRIPLDIAFLDAAGVIGALDTMSPCRSEAARDCPVYPAGVPFRAALEANAGYFAAHGLEVGDRIDLSPWLEGS